MIDRPLVIVGAPRSGSTILQRCLAMHPDVWHLARESHKVLEGPFHPEYKGYESNRVTAEQVTPDVACNLRIRFRRRAINLNMLVNDPSPFLTDSQLGARVASSLALRGLEMLSGMRRDDTPIRFLEKTPKNALRVPMLETLFPDAHYVWLTRDADTNIDSLIGGWRASDRFGPFRRPRYTGAAYPIAAQLALRDYRGKWWKFALVPGWRELRGRTVADVAAWQYYQCNRYLRADLELVDGRRIFSLKYEELVREPVEALRQILDWADLPRSALVDSFARVFPRVNATWDGTQQPASGLRYPTAVHAAMDRLPALPGLLRAIGYPA